MMAGCMMNWIQGCAALDRGWNSFPVCFPLIGQCRSVHLPHRWKDSLIHLSEHQ